MCLFNCFAGLCRVREQVWYVGAGLFEGGSSTWEAVSVGPLVPETWSHRGWGFMSLVEEVNPLAPKVVGVPFEFFFLWREAGYDVFVEPFLYCMFRCIPRALVYCPWDSIS